MAVFADNVRTKKKTRKMPITTYKLKHSITKIVLIAWNGIIEMVPIFKSNETLDKVETLTSFENTTFISTKMVSKIFFRLPRTFCFSNM